MSVRKLFEDYRFMRLEIERLKRDDCMTYDMVMGSHPESPFTKHPIRLSGVDQQRKTANIERIETLEARCAEVDAAIAMAPNSQIRVILMLKYQDGLSWVDVGAQMDMSADACRMVANKFFEGK